MKHEDFIVSMKGIQKSFGGVHALTDGELTLRKGEVLGLIGENGAGKSTLMKILSGVYQADAGVMMVDGKEVHYHEPRQALHDGICMMRAKKVLWRLLCSALSDSGGIQNEKTKEH